MSHHRIRRRPLRDLEQEASRRKLVICSDDGLRPGYLICLHVLDGIRPQTHVIEPKPGALGEILCSANNHTAEEITLICDVCAWERRFTHFVPPDELPLYPEIKT